MRHRWLLVLGCIIGLTLVVTLTVFFLALGAPTPAYSAADASWAACPSSAATAASLEELPPELLAQIGLPAPALGDVGQGWCEGCTCFRRCVFGASGGLMMREPRSTFRECQRACGCVLPLPETGCGDGVRRNESRIAWFGTVLHFSEECDDGNTVAGDGCDRWFASLTVVAIFSFHPSILPSINSYLHTAICVGAG